jgi:uncharacterized protein YkwD
MTNRKSKKTNRGNSIVVLVFALMALITACEKDTPTSFLLAVDDTAAYVTEQRLIIFGLTNQARDDAGESPLVLDPELNLVAQAHARDMAEREFFSHTNPDGLSPFDRLAAAGIEYHSAGENIAWYPSAETAVQGWINSPGHYENMVRTSFGRIGIGVYKQNPEESGNFYYVQVFTD